MLYALSVSGLDVEVRDVIGASTYADATDIITSKTWMTTTAILALLHTFA